MNTTTLIAIIITIALLIILTLLGNGWSLAEGMIPATQFPESEGQQADIRARYFAMRMMAVAGATMAVLVTVAISFTMIRMALNLTKAELMRKPSRSERLESNVMVQRNAIDAVALALRQLPPTELSRGDRAFIEWYDRDSNSS